MGYMASAGSALLSNPTALLGAAGVAWGIFETLQGGGQGRGRLAAVVRASTPPAPA
jgi:hypothetical protein